MLAAIGYRPATIGEGRTTSSVICGHSATNHASRWVRKPMSSYVVRKGLLCSYPAELWHEYTAARRPIAKIFLVVITAVKEARERGRKGRFEPTAGPHTVPDWRLTAPPRTSGFAPLHRHAAAACSFRWASPGRSAEGCRLREPLGAVAVGHAATSIPP